MCNEFHPTFVDSSLGESFYNNLYVHFSQNTNIILRCCFIYVLLIPPLFIVMSSQRGDEERRGGVDLYYTAIYYNAIASFQF